MKNSGYQLTYGVEIEFVLVFHEKLIYAQLAHNRGHQISFNDDYRPSDAEINGWFEKILSPEVRAQINPAPQVYRQTRPQYLAWGVKLRGLERPNPTEATYSEDKKLRTYKSEHLYIAQEILRSAAQNEALQYWNTTFPSDTRVSVGPTPDEWHLRKEAVIEALTQTELEHYLATSKKCFARDGPTSEQRSKRHLSQDISPISGSAPKKQKLTQAPFSIYSSSQSNDSNQENITPQKESMTASKSNNPQSSSSSGPQNPFAQGSNTAPLDLTQAFGATMASSPQGSSINASYTPTPAQRPGLNSRVQVSESTQQSQPANQQDSSTFGAPFSLVSFYDPKIAARDRKNRTLDEILGWDDDRLEREHDYMQLLFPLPEPSTHNPYAPVVDELTFRAFRTRKDLEDQVLRSLDRMYQFFGYSRDGPIVTKNENYIIASRRWNEATSHNHQRIIRIIRSLRILGVRRESHNLFRTLSQGRGVGSSTKQRWHDAVRLPLWVVPGDRTDLRVSRPFLDESYVVLPLEPPTSTDAKTSNTPPSQNPPLGWQQSTTSAPTGQPNTTAADLPISFITVTTPDHTAPSRPPKTFNETISRPAATVDQGTTSDPEARLPETSEWDSQGAVLVSKMFRPTDSETGFTDISNLCNRLKGKPCHWHGATAGPKTGLHVHMKPAKGDADLATLQYLLYILLMYEKEINTLLPHYRRTDSTSDTAQNELRSNCTTIHTANHNTPPPTQVYPATEIALDEVRTMIFDQEGSVLDGLVYLSGGEKERAVNFIDLLPNQHEPQQPRTIEFRQHESVLRGEMLQYWVRFCAGLLRVANHRAHFVPPPGVWPGATTGGNPNWTYMTAVQIAQYTGTSTPFIRTDRIPNLDSRGFPFAEWDDSMSVFDLIEEMELDDETAQYFHRRAAFFAAQDPGFPTVAPPETQDTDPSAPVQSGSAQKPISVGSTPSLPSTLSLSSPPGV